MILYLKVVVGFTGKRNVVPLCSTWCEDALKRWSEDAKMRRCEDALLRWCVEAVMMVTMMMNTITMHWIQLFPMKWTIYEIYGLLNDVGRINALNIVKFEICWNQYWPFFFVSFAENRSHLIHITFVHKWDSFDLFVALRAHSAIRMNNNSIC